MLLYLPTRFLTNTKIIHIALSCINIIVSVYLPRVSYILEKDSSEEVKDYIDELLHYLYMFLVACVIGIYILGKWVIVLIFGSDFADAYFILCILALDLLIYPSRVVFENLVFIPNHYEKIITVALAVSAVVNIGANFILIHLWGSIGAAIASMVSESSILTIYLFFARKKSISLNIWGNIKIYMIGGFGSFFLCVLEKNIIRNEIALNIISLISAAFTYFFMLILKKDKYLKKIYVHFISFITHEKKRWNKG